MKQQCYNLLLLEYKKINLNKHQFIIEIDNLFNIQFEMTYKKRINKNNIQNILNTILFDSNTKNIIKANDNFNFTNHQISDINNIVMMDYYKIKNEDNAYNFIIDKYINNMKFMNTLNNFYTLSVMKKTEGPLQIFI
jgi:hypothetical protein